MAIKYKAFTAKADADRIMVEFLENQERDHFVHTLNKARYEKILKQKISQAWRDRIQSLLDETVSRIEEVTSVIEASADQLPSDAAIAEVMETLRAERAARK